jgi:hypothetical protein
MKLYFRRNLLATSLAALAVCLLGVGSAAPVSASPQLHSTNFSFTSQSCVSQVREVAASQGFNPAPYLAMCQTNVTTTVGAVQSEAVSKPGSAAVSPAPVRSVNTVASRIYYQDWSQTYWGGSIWERHSGRTYWDGSRAWVSSYRGYSGSHTCHATGSWAAGAAITVLACNRPGSGSSATSQERFQTDWILKGVGLSYTAEINARYTASGVYSTWQVGG